MGRVPNESEASGPSITYFDTRYSPSIADTLRVSKRVVVIIAVTYAVELITTRDESFYSNAKQTPVAHHPKQVKCVKRRVATSDVPSCATCLDVHGDTKLQTMQFYQSYVTSAAKRPNQDTLYTNLNSVIYVICCTPWTS